MTKRTILFPFILTMVSLGLAFFQVWPIYQDLNILQSDVEVTQQQLDNREMYFSQLKTAKQKLDSHDKEMAKIDEAIPFALALPALYDHFEALSFSTGVLLLSIGSTTDPFSEESDSSILRTSVALKLLGSYTGLKEFLSQLNASPRFINVDSISFGAPTEEGAGIAFSIVVNTYSY